MEQFSFLMTSVEVRELKFIAAAARKEFENCVSEALEVYRGRVPGQDGELRPPEYVYCDTVISVTARKPQNERCQSASACRCAVRQYFRTLREEHHVNIPWALVDGRYS